jgi:hypothetical protein
MGCWRHEDGGWGESREAFGDGIFEKLWKFLWGKSRGARGESAGKWWYGGGICGKEEIVKKMIDNGDAEKVWEHTFGIFDNADKLGKV